MRSYIPKVILFAVLFGFAATVVSADEGEGNPQPEGQTEAQPPEKRYTEEELKDGIHEKEQDERIIALDKAISNQYWVFGSILAGLTAVSGLIIFILNLWYRRKESQAVTKLQKRYEDMLDKLYCDLSERTDTITRETEGYRERLKELTEVIALDAENAKELINRSEYVVRSAAEALPDISEVLERSSVIKEVLEKYPTLTENANFLYIAAMKGDIKDLPTLENIAKSLYINEEYYKSLDIIGIIELLAPKNPYTYYNKGLILLNLEMYEEAVKVYNKAINLKPDYVEAYNNKGVALNSLKKYPEALSVCNKAIELKPDIAETYYNRGIALRNLGEQDEAVEAFDKAIELKPDYAEAYNNKGVALLGELENYDDAIKAFDKAIELKPDDPLAFDGKSIVFLHLRRYKEAVEASNMAIELEPDYANAYFNRACAYSLLGERKKMLSDLKKAIELDEELKLGEKYREKAKTDEDFNPYRDDPDFRRLVYPEDFKEGEESE